MWHNKYMEKQLEILKIRPRKNSLGRFICCLLFLLSLSLLFSCTNENGNNNEIKSILDLNNEKYTIGVGTGSHAQVLAEKELGKAKILYYNSESLGYNAVIVGQVDAYVFDRVPMEKAIHSGLKGVKTLDDNLKEITQIAIGIPKKPQIANLKESINKCLKELRKEGVLDEMYNRWVYEGNEEMPTLPEVKNPTQEIFVGTTGIVPPYTFYKGDKLCGYDIELAERLAIKLNAKMSFKVYDYDGIVAAIKTNDVDFVCANLNITKERAEAIDFSDVIYENYVTAMVRDHKSDFSIMNFINDIKSSFQKTFVREERYKLFIKGIFCTLRITIISIMLGTALGFILFLICYNMGVIANSLIKTIFWLLRRIPIIVLLMVFYYIIFSNLSINSEVAATLVFTIVFGSLVAELLIATIKNIDVGQTEAAYALGFSKENTFFKILLPQSLPIMFPTYKNMIVEHIRSTAVVGYVAVQDLTKVGDIVRNRTYDAFFPLIAVAAIYVILAEVLIFFVAKLNMLRGVGKDSKYLKGVKRHD